MTNGKTFLENTIIFDKGLSLEAIGLYAIIKYYSTISNFQIKREHIKSVSGYGETAFRRVWKELKENNILKEHKKRVNGKFDYEFTLLTSGKSEDKKSKVDSNGQKPLDGQIEVEEALEQVEKEEINKIIKATGVTEEEAREELRVAKSKEGIKDIVQYTIGTINNKKRIEKELEKTVANKKQEINPRSFNNFPAREYDYDDLERKLLGWDKDEEEEQEIEFLN